MQHGRKAHGQHLEDGMRIASKMMLLRFHISMELLSSPQEAEEGREGVGEAADPLHDLGDDDLVTVRARELHRVLAQQLHGHNEAAAAVTAESTAAAA